MKAINNLNILDKYNVLICETNHSFIMTKEKYSLGNAINY